LSRSERTLQARRQRAALEAHQAEQAPPRWQAFGAQPINLDRDLSQEPQPGDEYAYW
jgi:hypothetical protein